MPKSSRLFFVGQFLLCFGCTFERWNSPADELNVTLGFYKKINGMETDYFTKFGEYADMQNLLHSFNGKDKYRLKEECEGGYCFEVRTTDLSYTIRIRPQLLGGASRGRHLSLYADYQRAIHVSYGLPLADDHSAVLSPKEIERFTP